MVTFAKKNKEGYFTYTATSKPNGDIENRDKTSFLVYFDRWNWTIGTGFYLKEVQDRITKKESELKEKYKGIINKILILSLLVTIVLLFMSFYASRIISNKFKMYKNQIEEEISKRIEKDKLLIQQSKLATMGEMMANITHQWRQPLSLISTISTGSLLEKEMNNLSDEKFTESMNSINEASQYLSQTIEDFRNFFNPNHIDEEIEIKRIIEKSDNLICSRFKDNEIELIKNVENFEIKVQVSSLLQVLINILKNARDELAQKNSFDRKLIFISTKKLSNKFVIKIKDNAGGISLENMDKIFEPYFTTKTNLNGTGIGLYMSMQIIEKMNGSLKVHNDEFEYEGKTYKGAEFVIELPFNI